MTLYGIDASNHQGPMTGLADYPASFFVHKLTESTTYTDPDAARNLAMARRLRVPVLGGYHYLRHGNGIGEADFFAARARQLFGHDLRGFLWQLDCEADATYRDVESFKRRWDKGTGAPILFYTGDWWLKPRGWNIERLGFAGLWAAPNRGYVGTADRVGHADWDAGYGGFDRLTICQYAARQGLGDTNLYAGSLDQLRALTGATSSSKDDDMPTRTSLGIGEPQPVPWGRHTVIRWGHEWAGPDRVHANGEFPGYLSPASSWADFNAQVQLDGTRPGDQCQMRLVVHDWHPGHGATSTWREVIADGTASTGDHYLRGLISKGLSRGQHVYVDIAIWPGDGDTTKPAPRVVGGRWTIAQDQA